MTSGEPNCDLSFRMQVNDAALAQHLAERSRQYEPPERPALEILQQFVTEKIDHAVREGEPVRAVQALGDLRVVLTDLVATGHKEFKPTLVKVDLWMGRFIKDCRERLVETFLDPATSAKEAVEIQQTLAHLIENGGWPGDWAREFNDVVWRRAMEHLGVDDGDRRA